MSLFLPLAWFLACTPGFPDPTLTSIDPRSGYNGEQTQVVLSGSHFFPAVELDAGEQGARLDRQFEVDLYGTPGEFALEGVESTSYEQIVAFVPEGLPVGQYGVRVTTPSGGIARLPHSFRVTDTRADHLAFDLSEVVQDVNEPFVVGFDLRDPAGLVVFQQLDVRLSIAAEDGSVALDVDAEGLAGASVETIDGGVEILGTLRPSGHGYVELVSSTREDLALTLSPADGTSFIADASAMLAVTAGQLHEVRIEVPGSPSPFVATAGQPFDVKLSLVDEWGNLLDDARATLALYERCGGFSAAVEITGQATVNLAMTTATDDTCTENALVAAGTTSGESTPFEVLPGAATAYDVVVYPNRVIAGTQVLYVDVEARDDWENVVTDYGLDWEEETGLPLGVTLYDDLGGLDPDVGYGEQICPGFEGGRQVCEVFLWTAGSPDRLIAVGDDGLRGKSPEFDVHTGPLGRIHLDVAAGPFVAGVPFDVEVLPTDAYLNAIAVDPSTVDFVFTGDPGELGCAWDGSLPADGRRTFACIATLATEAQQVGVALPSLDPTVSATSDSFRVDNGALAVAEFDFGAGMEWEAGATFTFGLQGLDAWGNDYLVQSDPVVQIEDDTGSLVAADVTLDASGWGSGVGSITVASPSDHLTATQYGVALGSSEAFSVVHAALDGLYVEPARGWAFLGDDLAVAVTATDAYGNPVTGFTGPAVLGTQGETAEQVLLETFDGGTASATLRFSTPLVGETLSAWAEDSGVGGTFTPLDVLESSCGVSAALVIDGVDEPVICSTASVASADLDASGSSGATLFRFSDSDGLAVRGASDVVTATWTGDGPRRVTLVAFDGAGCGSQTDGLAWIGPPDGTPVGPVAVIAADAERTVGSSSSGITRIDVQAFDCALDVAAYGTLLARTDLGTLPSGLTSTGAGLELALDAAGHGQFTWSVATEIRGGTSNVWVGRDGGIALGATTIEAVGDDALPVVLEVDPAGAVAETTDTFQVRFDEPMRAASLTTATVALSDGLGPLALTGCALDASATELTLTLAEAVDLALEPVTMTLSTQVRDVAGNRLDGAWSGSAADFLVEIGLVPDTAPDLLACTADTDLLRPDGDGALATAEADEVEILVSAASAPTWWHLSVLEDGDERLVRWSAAAGATETLSWDARGQEGAVLPNGSYVLQIAAADPHLDLGAPCTLEIAIENRLEDIP